MIFCCAPADIFSHHKIEQKYRVFLFSQHPNPKPYMDMDMDMEVNMNMDKEFQIYDFLLRPCGHCLAS